MRFTASTRGVPAYARAALIPIPSAASTRASTGGLVHVVGHPGDRAIPVSKPGAIPETAAGWRGNQPSYNSPDVMYPSTYYTTAANMHPPVGLLRDNPMPVPARSLFALPGISQRGRRIGGQSQIVQPAVVQVWPAWRSGGR